jgi:hypothetical protein
MTAIGHEGPGLTGEGRSHWADTPGHSRPDGVCGALTACAFAFVLMVG